MQSETVGAKAAAPSRRPQKELLYNRLLPYAAELPEEADRLLRDIREHLAVAVALRELKPGCAIWTARLIKYIKLYGLKFSKECHIEFIKLVYELIIVPDLEPSHLHKFCTLMVLLTKKVHLISPEELTLPWRPLHDIGKKVFSKNIADYGMYHFLSSLESTFGTMVQYIKPYFPLTATQEILDEFLPRFIPWHNPNQDIIQDLVLYLPYQTLPKHMDQGFKLWFEDFMELWRVCHNSGSWELDMMTLMANLAFNNIGYIDWEPHYSLMFTKFLRSFNLPVFYKKTQNNKHHGVDTTSMALWIVSTLGPKSSAQNYLDNFMTTVATYLHGANTGRWSKKLRDLLRKLPLQFIHRLHKERSTYKVSWEPKTPDSHKLTSDDITRFVECMLDVSLQSMFSRMGTSDACVALQQLALLKPEMVIPPIIDKMWNTLDSLTEPHKLTSAIQCVVAVARPLTFGFNNGYPEGPTHVIPLLLSCLPGLDPNDFKKTLVTLHFITVFCNLVLIVDCSGASEHWPDLTEEERTVCEATAQFEDFVLQYFDKVFVLIESSSMEHTRMEQKEAESIRSKLESTSEGALASTTISILVQSSTAIFKMALKKMFNFVTQRILETNVAGQTAAAVCRAFSRINARETFKLFIPHLCDTIEGLCENEEIFKEESLDKELLFNLLLLSHILEKSGEDLLPYIPRVLKVIDKTLNISCKEGYSIVCSTIKYTITSLSTVYHKKCKSSTADYDASVKDFLAIREWGKPGDIQDCDLKWHIPNKNEVACVEMIVRRYLLPEMDRLNKYISGELTLSREELNKCLSVVKALMAANNLMPPWDNNTIELVQSNVPWGNFNLCTGVEGSISMPDGSNIRKTLTTTMHALQSKLLNSNEDDTKSLCKLITIWESLTAPNNNSTNLFETHWKIFSAVKRSLEDKLQGRVGHLRVMLAERALLQHEFRMQSMSGPMTVTQAENMKAIFTLATSRYSEVRTVAQCRLNWMVSSFAYSYKIIQPQLVECLAVDSDAEHDRLKGALYCILGPKQTPIIAKHDWSVVSELWPALINSNPSEKPSVIRLLDSSVRSILTHFPTITINLKWSDSCVERGKALLSQSELSNPEFLKKIANRDEVHTKLNKENEDMYMNLLNAVLRGAESTNLHWRHSLMCVSLLPTLVHLDIFYPPRVINLIMKCLIHDSILVRKIALKLMVYVLRQRKKTHKRVFIDSEKLTGVADDGCKKRPGFRPDNIWLQFDVNKVHTEEDWDNSPYMHNESYGFYYWPKTVKMFAPPKEQPEYEFNKSELNEAELEIYHFFTSSDNIDKLIKYHTLEDKKGKDKFAVFRYLMFKGLFSNYIDSFLPMFLDHLKRLVSDKQEANQRCAAEIIAGIICGTKHWPFTQVTRLQTLLTPILKTVLDNITEETLSDWGLCFATFMEKMDVSRYNWIFKILEESIVENGSSSLLCSRLIFIRICLMQHPWRLAVYSHRLLKLLRDKGMLAHSYQNVRDRVASLLGYIFETDVTFPGSVQNIAPSIADIIDDIMPQMDLLIQEGLKAVSANNSILPILNLATGNNHVKPSKTLVEIPKAPSAANDKVKGLPKRGSVIKIDRENMNMDMVNKLMQNVANSNTQGKLFTPENMQELVKGHGSLSSLINSGFMDNVQNKMGDAPFMDKLGEKIRTVLKICDDIPMEDTKVDSDYTINIRLYKTIVEWITLCMFRYQTGIKSSYYKLVPVACVLGNREDDEELHQLSAAFLSTLAEALHDLDQLKTALKTMQQVCKFPSWCARVSCLSFLQSLVFHNMPIVINSDIKMEVRHITLELMNDSTLEVREAAAVMFAGLLHCGVLTDIPDLMKHFKSLCNGGKVIKGPNRPEAIARLHCGVLGLCAFIAAQPYTVPSYLPEIFLTLGLHINDPMPIPSTIRKTLGDFKRTHHDDWQTHQLKFTEEELALLSDLTVPPSYYA